MVARLLLVASIAAVLLTLLCSSHRSPSTAAMATAHAPLPPPPPAVLPTDTLLSYLAEGAANVIYRLSAPPGCPQFPHQLLRARKALPSTQPNELAFAQLLNTFHPMFPPHLLLTTSLVRLPMLGLPC